MAAVLRHTDFGDAPKGPRPYHIDTPGAKREVERSPPRAPVVPLRAVISKLHVIARETKTYYTSGMDEAARIQAAAELLSTVYPAERVGKALKDLAAETARETTTRGKATPRPDWIEARARGVTLPDFIAEKFETELRDGTMARAKLRRFASLYGDYYNHLDQLPPELQSLPTKSALNDRQVVEGKVKPVRPVVPPPPRTDG